MRRVGLVVNPKAGRGPSFDARLGELLRVFAAHGIETTIERTTANPDSARDLAVQLGRSCGTVIACGGDGTVHGVLQGVAGTSIRLGVLPFGTANALVRNLRLPLDPIQALHTLLTFTAKQIPLGYAETSTSARWFIVMAGAGPDGRLVHEMKVSAKAYVGRGAYYAEAGRLFITRRFPKFRVEYRQTGSLLWESRFAVAMMASRIPDLGGLFRGLTASSRLHHPHLLIQMLAAPAHLALPAWLALGRSGFGRANPWLTTLEVEEMRCIPTKPDQQIFAQVDGEMLGLLPMNIRIAPASLCLLMP